MNFATRRFALSSLFFAVTAIGSYAVPYTYPGTGAWLWPSANIGNQRSPSNRTFPMDATVSETPPQITLRIFSTTTGAGFNTNISGTYDIFRKAPDSSTWGLVATGITVGTTNTTWTDTNVVVGQMYEYAAAPTGTRTQMYGYILAGIKADQTQPKGRVALVVASDVVANLPVEYAQYKADLVADGWVVNEIICNRAASYHSNGTGANDSQGVPTAPYFSDHVAIKNQIVSLYQDSANQFPGLPLKNVILLGKVPLPRSGLSNLGPDGHGNEAAVGADAFYADMDGVWTDLQSNEPFMTAGAAVREAPINNADFSVVLPTSMFPSASGYLSQIKTARQTTAPGGSAPGTTQVIQGYPYTFTITNGVLVSMASAYADTNLAVDLGRVNLPGDNKFDAEYLSQITPNTNLELGFGRIDFANQVPDEIESMRNYLNKDHRYKSASPDFLPGRTAIERGGSAGFGNVTCSFLASMPSALGMAKLTLIDDSDLPSVPPNYDADAGYSAAHPSLFYFKESGGPDFSDGSKAVFWTGMQSHWGYWFDDGITSGQNAMPLRLGEDNYTLSYTWAIGQYSLVTGFLYHRMGMGFDTGDMMRISMSNRSGANPTYAAAQNPLFMEHMGDPTLRLFMFPPPSRLSVVRTGGAPTLSWKAAPAPAATEPQVIGYHVYRGPSANGPFTRLTSSPVAGTTYVDSTVSSGSYAYMVRAIRLETTGGGTFYNASLGTIQTIDLSNAPAAPQVATSTLPDAPWNTPYSFTLQGSAGTPVYTWVVTGGSLPPGLSLNSEGTISGLSTQAGTYNFTVTATDAAGQTAQRSLTLTALSNDTQIFYPEAGQFLNSSGTGSTAANYLQISGPSYSYSTYLRFNLSTLNSHQGFIRARLLVNGGDSTNPLMMVKTALTTDAGDGFTSSSITYATRPLDDTTVAPASASGFIAPYQVLSFDLTNMVRATLRNDAAKQLGLRLYSPTGAAFANQGHIASLHAPLTSRPRLIVETSDAPAITVSSPLSNPATIKAGCALSIVATVNPKPPRTANSTWSKVSGPGSVVFGSPSSPSSLASFSVPGEYVIRLSAGDGVLQSSQDITVRVAAEAAPANGTSSGLALRLPLDASSGTVATDASALVPANNGALNGNPIWAPAGGKIGGALTLDGTGDRITVPDSATNLLDGGNQLSVSCWVYLTSTSGTRALVVKRASAGVGESYTISLISGKPQIDIGLYSAAATNRLSSANALSINTWHHLVFVFDGTLPATGKRIVYFVDGVADSSKATTVSSVPRNSTAPLRIGGYDTDPNGFLGSIDEVRIYNKALNFTEIQDLFQAAPSNIGPFISLASNTVTGSAGQPFNLAATVTDDGLPSPLAFGWNQLTGPGSILFATPGAANTTGTAPVGGSYSVRLLATDGDITTAADVAATITGVNFTSWAAGYGLTGGNAATGASPAHDGVPNLLKYALGLDPTQNYNSSSAGLPATQLQTLSDGDYLTLSFNGIATDVVYVVEATSDLTGAWTPLYTFSGPGAPGPVTVTDSQKTSASPKRFIRLRVAQP